MNPILLPAYVVPKSKYFFEFMTQKWGKKFEEDFNLGNVKEKPSEYLSQTIFSMIVYFIIFTFFLNFFFQVFDFQPALFWAFVFSTFITAFFFMQALIFPKRLSGMRVTRIESNIMQALQDMLVQVSANVPLFNIMANIADGEYGEISEEFKRATKQITSGRDEIDVLEEMARDNPSKFFRRAIWQIVNSAKSGSKIADAIKESIRVLEDEQETQIQQYGSSLSGMIVMYMLISIVVPALFITFFVVISTFINITPFWTILVLVILYLFVMFFEIMFLGLIKLKRPRLV